VHAQYDIFDFGNYEADAMEDRQMFLQTLGRAIEMMQQVDILAYRDDSWPERITPDRRSEFIK